MVQMGDNSACSRAMLNLGGCYIFNSKMTLGSVCLLQSFFIFAMYCNQHVDVQ